MRTLHVVTGYEQVPELDERGHPVVDAAGAPVMTTEESVHEFRSEHVAFVTEPSGVLVMFRAPNDMWAAYAPGSWVMVKEVPDGAGQD